MDLVFTKDKETKRKVRFTLEDGPIAGGLYVEKDKIKEVSPDGKTLTLQLKEGDDGGA